MHHSHQHVCVTLKRICCFTVSVFGFYMKNIQEVRACLQKYREFVFLSLKMMIWNMSVTAGVAAGVVLSLLSCPQNFMLWRHFFRLDISCWRKLQTASCYSWDEKMLRVYMMRVKTQWSHKLWLLLSVVCRGVFVCVGGGVCRSVSACISVCRCVLVVVCVGVC